MNAGIFIKGIIVGFFLCAPLGPIGLFCARKTLLCGPVEGIAALLGASTAEFIYCCLAGLSIGLVTNIVTGSENVIRFLGSLALVVVGIRLFYVGQNKKEGGARGVRWMGAYASTFLFTLVNPIPIIVFTATFAGLGLQGWQENWISTGALVFGITLGSTLWSPVLVATVCVFRRELGRVEMKFMNKLSGVLIVVFGILVGSTALMK